MDLTRQLDLIDIDRLENIRIMVIGVGGIGAMLAYTLAKMGVQHIQIWDRDKVEEHNVPNQFHSRLDIGEIKVDALSGRIKDDVGTIIDYKNEFWDGKDLSFEPDIIISGVDSMKVRKKIWSGIKESGGIKDNVFYLDARMSSKSLSIFVTRLGEHDSNKEQYQRYENTLYDDSEAVQEPCTARVIFHRVLGCSYYIGTVIHDLIDNRDVFASYHAQLQVRKCNNEALKVN